MSHYTFLRADLAHQKLTLSSSHEVISQVTNKVPLQLMAPGKRETPAKSGEFYCRDVHSCFELSFIICNLLKAELKMNLVSASAAASAEGFELYVFDAPA